MNCYFFVLGRSSTLSVAEISAYLLTNNIPFQTQHISREILIIKTSESLSASTMKQLGGSIKFGEIVSEVDLDAHEEKFLELFSPHNLTTKFFANQGKKLHFGISIYYAGGDQRILSQLVEKQQFLNQLVKDNLKTEDVTAGFVRNKDRFLSSVSVVKNKLLSHGTEIVVSASPTSILVGKTVATQDFAAFTMRDMNRPRRDKRSGIMPPKLARMMIHLSMKPTNATILDPFCGSGTVIQEAILLGYQQIIGTDVSKKAIEDTKQNIEWLKRLYPQKQTPNVRLFTQDVVQLSRHMPNQSVDAIITEPFLGPMLTKKPDIRQIKRLIHELESLYSQAFTQFHTVMKSDATIVIIFPTFRTSEQIHYIEILEKVRALGFIQRKLLPLDMEALPGIRLTHRNSILFEGDFQFLQREILAFQKK